MAGYGPAFFGCVLYLVIELLKNMGGRLAELIQKGASLLEGER
jgi:hypothetical protein